MKKEDLKNKDTKDRVKNIIPDIQIKDNFFSKKEFNILLSNIHSIPYESQNNLAGNFGFRHQFKKNSKNNWIFNKIKKHFFPNLDLELFESAYHLRHNKTKPLVHRDPTDYNFILYLEGKEIFYNGTGFYNSEKNLDRYVGFFKNRALFFNGKKIFHTDLQALGKSSPRYTINIFYTKPKF